MRFHSRVVALLFLCFSLPSFGQSIEDDHFEKIASRYHSLMMRRPQPGTAFDLLFRHYLDAGRLPELQEHYESLVEKAPNNAAALLTLGLIRQRRSQVDDALKAFEKAAKLTPDDFHAVRCHADALARLHRDEQAAQKYRQAIENRPPRGEQLEVYKSLAQAYARMGDDEAALKVWSEFLENNPDDLFSLEQAAELLAEQEHFEEAIERYKQLAAASQANPFRRISSRIEIAQIQVKQGKLKSAIATFQQCLDSVKPDSWLARDVRRRIEEIFERSDDLSGLADHYRSWLKDRPDDLQTMLRLARTTARLGDINSALEQYRQALTLAPTDRDVRQALIDQLVLAERHVEAVAEAEALAERFPNDVPAVLQLGDLHLAAVDRQSADRAEAEQKALAAWKSVASIREDDPMMALHVAERCRQAAEIGPRQEKTQAKVKQRADSLFGEAALAHYREAARRAPSQPQYHEYLGEFLYAIGRDEDAVAAWNKIAQPPRDTADNLKRLAEVLQAAGQEQAAVDAIAAAIAKDPKRYDLHAAAVDLFVNRKEFEPALRHVALLEELADSKQMEEEALQRRVEVLSFAERLDEEYAKTVAAIQETGSARLRHFAALLAAARRQPAEALKHLDSALKLKPDDAKMLRLKASLYQKAGDLAGAVKQYYRLADLEPARRSQHLSEAASLELELGRHDAARQAARDVIRYTPNSIEGFQLLADICLRTGQPDEAMEAMYRAVRVDPRDVDLRQSLARRLSERQRLDEAIEHYWRAFELAENLERRLNITHVLAEQYMIAGKLDRLVSEFQRRRRLTENEWELSLCLATVHLFAQDYDKARSELTALAAEREDDVWLLSQLAALSERLDDTEKAISYHERIVELLPETSRLEKLSQLYEEAGREDDAQRIWKQIVEQAKDDDAILSAIDRAERSGQYDQVVFLASPRWTKRPDDWRYGHRLALAYWRTDQQDQAIAICEDILKLTPSLKYEKKQTPPKTYTPSYSTTPEVFQRIQMASQYRTMLTAQAGSSGPFGSSRVSTWKPSSLEDAQMSAAMMRYEAARLEERGDAVLEDLVVRSENDMMAAKQAAWISYGLQNRDAFAKSIANWQRLNPSDADPRLLQYYLTHLNRNAGTPAISDELFETLEENYRWLKENRPSLTAAANSMRLSLLVQYNRHDAAADAAKEAIAEASNLNELAPVSHMIQRLQTDQEELLSLFLIRAQQLQSAAPSMFSSQIAQVAQRMIHLTAQKEDWAAMLKTLEDFLAATHPASTRGSFTSTAPSSPYTRQVAMMTSGGVVYRTVGGQPAMPFPSATNLLDGGRLQMLQTTYGLLRNTDRVNELTKVIDRRAEQDEGLAQSCWKMCRVCVDWWQGDRAKAVAALQEIVDGMPRNVSLRMTLSNALAQMGETKKALSAIADVRVPFGRDAKAMEQLRLRLAQQAGDEETGKEAALRLYGMRLSASEQTQLAQNMKRYKLANHADELMRRAVRSAGGKTQDLYKVMQSYAQTDMTKAAGVAKLLLRSTRGAAAGRSSSSTRNYRTQAYRILHQSGDLEQMIEKAERQQEAAPNSVAIMEDLLDYYTAAGERAKAQQTLDRLVEAKPDDASFQYRIASSLAQKGKVKEAVARLGVVWEKDFQQITQQYSNIANWYASAGEFDLLAEHILKAKGSPVMRNYGSTLVNMVQRAHQRGGGASVDQTCKLYEAAIEASDDNYQAYATQRYATYLNQAGREKLAMAVYENSVFDAAKPSGSRYADSYSQSNMSALVSLAGKTGEEEGLAKRIQAHAEKHPSWKYHADLLVGMLKLETGDEAPLRELGRRWLDDEEYRNKAADVGGILRQQLSRCQDRETLLTAVKVWTTHPASGTVHPSDANTANNVANLWFRLKEPEKAREVLWAALDAALPAHGGQMTSQVRANQIQMIAPTFARNGYPLDALFAVGKFLEEDLNWSVSNNSSLMRTMQQVARNAEQHLKQVESSKLDEARQLLLDDINSDEPAELSRFFFVVDPPPAGASRAYGGYAMSSYSSGMVVSDPFGGASSRRPSLQNVKQLLPAILLDAQAKNKLAEIAQAAKRRQEKSEEEDAHVAALSTLISLAAEVDDAAEKVEAWSQRVEKNPKIAAEAPTWLIARMAINNPKHAALGRQLAMAVANAAKRRGRTGRQQAAVALAVNAASAEEADQLLKSFAGGQGDSVILLRLAQDQFQKKQHARGLELLAPVWRRSPQLIVPQVQNYARQYIAAGKLDEFVEAIGSVPNTALLAQYLSSIEQVFGQLPKDEAHLDSVAKLYKTLLDVAPTQNQSGLDSRFATYLQGMSDKSRAYQAARKACLPSEGGHGRTARFASFLVQQAKETNQLDELAKACRSSAGKDPAFEEQSLLLLAMIDHSQGKQERWNELAKKYEADAAFANSLAPYESIIRSETQQCDPGPALRLSLKLFEKSASAEQGGSVSYTSSAAQILTKLGREEEARQRLLAALSRPPSQRYSSSSNFLERIASDRISLIRSVGSQLDQLGFKLDALAVYQSAGDVDLSHVRPESSVMQYVEYAMRSGRSIVASLLASEMDKTLDELTKRVSRLAEAAQEGADADSLAPFFVTLDPSPDNQQEPTELMPPLLDHAAKQGKLKGLSDAVSKARQSQPDEVRLASLNVLVSLRQKDHDRAIGSLQSLADAVSRDNKTLGASALHLALTQGMGHEATRAKSQQLAEKVVRSAGTRRAGRLQGLVVALAASLRASGREDDARELMKDLAGEALVSPAARLRMAQTLFRSGRADEAVEILAAVWKAQPGFALAEVEKLAPLYAKAGKIEALAEQIKSIKNTSLANSHSYRVSNAASRLSNDEQHREDAIKLYRAGLQFTSPNYRDNISNNLASLLSRIGRNDEAIEVHLEGILPSATPSSRLGYGVRNLATLAHRVGATEKVKQRIEAAAQKHPSFRGNADVALAMLDRAAGDEKPMEKLAERIQNDSAYASSVANAQHLLRNELVECESKPALELAVTLWRKQLDAYSSNSSGGDNAAISLAKPLIKLGRRDEARQTLLSALSMPQPNYTGNYAEYNLFQRRSRVAAAMSEGGFAWDALIVDAESLTSSEAPWAKQYNIDYYLNAVRTRVRESVFEMISKDIDGALAKLEETFAKQPSAADLDVWLTMADGAWSSKEQNAFPDHLKGRRRLQLLPAVVQHARHKGQLEQVKNMAAGRASSDPDSKALTAVAMLLRIAASPNEELAKELVQWMHEAKKSPALAEAPETSLLMQAALQSDELRPVAIPAIAGLVDDEQSVDRLAMILAATPSEHRSQLRDRLSKTLEAMRPKLVSEAAAHERSRRWSEAAQTLSLLIDIEPAADLYERRANARKSLGELDGAIADLSRTIEMSPENANARFERAGAYARQAKWKESAKDFEAALAQDPSNHWHWFRSACVQLERNNQAGYRQHCKEMLDRFADDQTYIGERVAKICLLQPGAVDDLSLVTNLAAKAEKHGPGHNAYYWYAMALGMARYRNGDYQSAIETLNKSVEHTPAQDRYCRPMALCYLSMAYAKHGDSAAASETLKKADQQMEQLPKEEGGDLGTSWHDILMCRMARKEAEAK